MPTISIKGVAFLAKKDVIELRESGDEREMGEGAWFNMRDRELNFLRRNMDGLSGKPRRWNGSGSDTDSEEKKRFALGSSAWRRRKYLEVEAGLRVAPPRPGQGARKLRTRIPSGRSPKAFQLLQDQETTFKE
jgi:hypothetical protein